MTSETSAAQATTRRCPSCGWSKSETVNGPEYKPRRWYRSRAYWRCTWCHFEWEDADDNA